MYCTPTSATTLGERNNRGSLPRECLIQGEKSIGLRGHDQFGDLPYVSIIESFGDQYHGYDTSFIAAKLRTGAYDAAGVAWVPR
jgi:hypothetical protein